MHPYAHAAPSFKFKGSAAAVVALLFLFQWGAILRLLSKDCGSLSNRYPRLGVTKESSPRRSAAPASLSDTSNNDKCSIYLAPSSVHDSNNRPAGFGIYTTKPLSKGSYIFPRGEGPSVVITDIAAHQTLGRHPVWAQYIFLYPCVGFNYEAKDPEEEKFSSLESNTNLGGLANFHPYLISARFDDVDFYDDGILNRYRDHGAGAFSYHMGKKWHTTRNVQAGEEIFVDYDERWFFGVELAKEEEGKNIPRRQDYIDAAHAIKSVVQGANSERRQIGEHNVELVRRKLLQGDEEQRRAAALLLLWNETDLVEMMKQMEVSEDMYADALARKTLLPRSVEWIERSGHCLDNIVPGRSSIPQAGQGAFAVRPLKRGEVVVPVPTLLQVPDKSTLSMYHHRVKGETLVRKKESPMSKQLILNYCFGHKESSMVLCPATNANLINHCSSRLGYSATGQCNEKGPNAVLRWAIEFDPETKDWLEQDLDEIARRVKSGRRGLSFEIVATGDIAPGDEIFLDYGPEWEAAWDRHVETWSPPRDVGYVSVSAMNANVTYYLRTVKELETNPYASDVRLGCYHQGFYHPCDILAREDFTEPAVVEGLRKRVAVYRVRLSRFHGSGVWEFKYRWNFKGKESIEEYLPETDIRFFHGVYSSDQHLDGTFRHQINVPDGMWPEHWKNLKFKEEIH